MSSASASRTGTASQIGDIDKLIVEVRASWKREARAHVEQDKLLDKISGLYWENDRLKVMNEALTEQLVRGKKEKPPPGRPASDTHAHYHPA